MHNFTALANPGGIEDSPGYSIPNSFARVGVNSYNF